MSLSKSDNFRNSTLYYLLDQYLVWYVSFWSQSQASKYSSSFTELACKIDTMQTLRYLSIPCYSGVLLCLLLSFFSLGVIQAIDKPNLVCHLK